MEVNINTKFITLIGTPLGQSFAARMQNAGYRAAGLNMLYFYSEVGNDHLADVINGVRYMPFAGCAVTKPNKVEVMKYLDGYDPLCEKMGSSNTVVKTEDGKLIGYNTDGYGALRSIKEHVGDLTGLTMFAFGAGGAGRSVCFEMANAGAKKLYIADLFQEVREDLCDNINKFFPGVCVPVAVGDEETIKAGVAESDIILNLSGLGMKGKEDKTPVDKSYLLPKHVCFDATYNPGETRFLREAKEVGCRIIINGLEMSLYQGVRQVELWTGGAARPEDAMRQELLDIIAGK